MKYHLLILVYLSVLVSSDLFGQVTIAPTNLFIDGNTRFGTYMVINGSNETHEVSIDFIFAYTRSNDEGTRRIVDNDPEVEDRFSIADYVRAFPRNFTLAPGQRQVVRLRLAAPNELDDGTYWARIKTASSPEAPPLELQATEAVAAAVGITVEQVTGLFYKKGSTTTGIIIDELTTELNSDSDSLVVLTEYSRTGNSPFLGSISTSILDSNGRVVKSGYVATSLYFDGVFRNDFDVSDLQPGNYSVFITFETSRSDISSQDLVQMEPVTETVTFTKR